MKKLEFPKHGVENTFILQWTAELHVNIQQDTEEHMLVRNVYKARWGNNPRKSYEEIVPYAHTGPGLNPVADNQAGNLIIYVELDSFLRLG